MFISWPAVRCHPIGIVGSMSATWTDSSNALHAMERAVMAERKLAVVGTGQFAPHSIDAH